MASLQGPRNTANKPASNVGTLIESIAGHNPPSEESLRPLRSGKTKLPEKAKQGAGASKKRNAQPRTAQHARGEDAAIDATSELWSGDAGAGRVRHLSGTGSRMDSLPSRDVIGSLVRDHLKSKGQTPGPQRPGMNSDIQSMQFLKDQGTVPGAGMHEPVLGGGGARPEGVANAGGNPLAPFMMQMLNPRMSPGSPQGAVPTLQGAPQGFSLYNMLRLISMFKQLYGQLPVGGQSLPAGVGGQGGMGGGY